MREKDFQSIFSKWIKINYKKSAVFELKLTHSNSIPFSAVVPHQIDALWNTKHRHIAYKLPDVGYQNPYDCIFLKQIPAFVVIKYPSFFCLIDIDIWIEESNISKRRSLTSERARELSTVVVD